MSVTMDNSEPLSDGVAGVHRHRGGGFRIILTDKQSQGPGWVSGQLEDHRKSVVGFLPKKQGLSKNLQKTQEPWICPLSSHFSGSHN